MSAAAGVLIAELVQGRGPAGGGAAAVPRPEDVEHDQPGEQRDLVQHDGATFVVQGRRIAYLSFPPGTLGHPADLDVVLRIIDHDGSRRDLVQLYGGQGTINVPSRAPDSRRLAYVAYPAPAG